MEFKLAYLKGGFTITILFSVRKCIYEKESSSSCLKIALYFGFNLYFGISQNWIKKKQLFDDIGETKGMDGSL